MSSDFAILKQCKQTAKWSCLPGAAYKAYSLSGHVWAGDTEVVIMLEGSEKWTTSSSRTVQWGQKIAHGRSLAEQCFKTDIKKGSWKASWKGRNKVVDIKSSEYHEKWCGLQGPMLKEVLPFEQ